MEERIEIVKTTILKQLAEINQLSGINSLILSVCLVDTLAGFFGGYDGKQQKQKKGGLKQKGNKDRYNDFLSAYLPHYRRELYDIRCNLAHSFSNTLARLLFIDNPEFTKIFGTEISILGSKVFNIDTFKSDLGVAVDQYFLDLDVETNTELRSKFLTRYDGLNILQDSKIGIVRNLKGEIVSSYDQLDTMPGLDLKIAVADGLPLKK